MIIKRYHLIIALLSIFLFSSCQKKSSLNSSRVIVGISADIQSLNPLYSFDVVEGSISELLYLSLVQHTWNQQETKIESVPMLAESWAWNKDSTAATLKLRHDVYWSDGKQCTAEDVVFSFDVYSDPGVQSKLFGTFNSFYTNKDLSINIGKTFSSVSRFELTINFLPHSAPSLFKIDFPILPKHIYEKVDRKNFASESAKIKAVTNGAFKFKKWDRDQAIVLEANQKSFLHKEGSISELIFKIVPNYTARLTQLKKGEIDFLEDIKPEDIQSLKKSSNLKIVPIRGREYEYIGWNNIDEAAYDKSGKIEPNELFGSSNVRKALTLAINREELLQEYLHNFGQLATGPVTPIFKNAINKELTPYPYDPVKASQMLAAGGWIDKDNDGILEKGNIKFSFTLYIPGGNPRRNYSATMIKNNLKAVGIEMNIATLELGMFIDKLFAKKLDAWLASWVIAVPVDLKQFWHSDLKANPLNAGSYQSKEADDIFLQLSSNIDEQRQNELYKKLETVIYNDQPVTFLYWVDNITAYNKRVKNVNINPLGFIHHCWEWRTD